MINDRHADPQGHPTEAEIIAWLDEPPKGANLAEHFESCDACRARLAEIERLLAALRAEPSPPSDEALATQRDEIMAAIEARPRQTGPSITPIRRWLWVPMAAAAAAAAFLLFALDRTVPPPSSGPDGSGQALPVVAGAEEAAEEAYLEVVGSGSLPVNDPAVTGPAMNEPAAGEMARIEAALVSLNATASVLTAEGGAIEDEFAALPAEDQETILDELSTMTFEL